MLSVIPPRRNDGRKIIRHRSTRATFPPLFGLSAARPPPPVLIFP
jgi:hypothetical protein